MFGDCRVSFQVSNISKSQEPSGRGVSRSGGFFALGSSPWASPPPKKTKFSSTAGETIKNVL